MQRSLAPRQHLRDVLDQLDRELIGLKPVKTRIREIASLLLIERIRKRMNLTSEVRRARVDFAVRQQPLRGGSDDPG